MAERKNPISQALLDQMSAAVKEYNHFPKEFQKWLKDCGAGLVHIHSHHNLEAVLIGMNRLAIGNVKCMLGKSVIAVDLFKAVGPNTHIWLGATGVKGVANCYVHSMDTKTNVAIIGCMSNEIQKGRYSNGK